MRQVVIPLWSSWYFFSLYANAAGYEAKWSTASTNVLDRYILAKTAELTGEVTAAMDAYDLAGACAAVSLTRARMTCVRFITSTRGSAASNAPPSAASRKAR